MKSQKRGFNHNIEGGGGKTRLLLRFLPTRRRRRITTTTPFQIYIPLPLCSRGRERLLCQIACRQIPFHPVLKSPRVCVAFFVGAKYTRHFIFLPPHKRNCRLHTEQRSMPWTINLGLPPYKEAECISRKKSYQDMSEKFFRICSVRFFPRP